jgi:anhydro-N-acetylmuramic acid kinase
LRAMNLEDGNEYAKGNYRFGEWCADRALQLLEEAGVDRATVALIGSHGQTVSGHPHWEFGDLSVIAQRTGITTAGDFRPADVAAGGNGTPCTCTYDSIMLRPPPGSAKWRVAINIGGTSSVTFLPPWPVDGKTLAPASHGLDPGLGVFFMDLAVRCIDPSLEYDDDGKMARTGKVHQGLLDFFLQNKYYQQPALPIGVGPDDFPETLFAEWRAKAQSLGVSDHDLLSTLTELTTVQIAKACARFGGEHVKGTDDVLLRGGVCNNSYFVERLLANISTHLEADIPKISTLADVGIDEDSWENAMCARRPPARPRRSRAALTRAARIRLVQVRDVWLPVLQQRVQLCADVHGRRTPRCRWPHRAGRKLPLGAPDRHADVSPRPHASWASAG